MKSTSTRVEWVVKGPRWVYRETGGLADDPVEIATQAVEQVWGEECDAWEDRKIAAQEGAPLSLGVFLEVSHNKMGGKEESILVPTSLALSNAGLFSESARLEILWNKMSKAEQLACVASYCGCFIEK